MDMDKTFIEQVQYTRSMLNDDFDWERDDWPSFDDEFRALLSKVPEDIEGTDYVECGSYRPDNPVLVLYRLLWLVQPTSVDFSDMYKKRLFWFMSKDKQVIVSVELYKYEPALYFYALRSIVDYSGASGVWGGFPGAENGQKLIDETAAAFVELVQTTATTPHMIYGGNDFEV